MVTLLRVLKNAAFRMLSPKQRFTRIYNLNTWKDPETVSGRGPALASTEAIRRELPQLIKSLGITPFLMRLAAISTGLRMF